MVTPRTLGLWAALLSVAGCHLLGGAADFEIVETSGGFPGAAGGLGGLGGAGQGGGCAGMPEDCLNGGDDDCDDAVDCDDSDCSDYACRPLPSGWELVAIAPGPGQCPAAWTEMAFDDCGACECELDSPGTCTHVAIHYDNAACAGAPLEEVVVPSSGCSLTAAVAAPTERVGAVAEQLPLADAACSPATLTAEIASVALCSPPAVGSCANGDACLEPGVEPPCILSPGDVSCPPSHLDKRLLHAPSGATSCDCACDGGLQNCDLSKHYHAFEADTCGAAKFDVVADGVCHDTGQPTVGSVGNHDQPLPATSATCENTSTPQTMPDPLTLCCNRRS